MLPDGRPSGTLRRRVDAALAHARRLDRPCILVTGGAPRVGPTEATLMRAQLEASGFPAERIVVEDRALDTLASVVNCRAILRDRSDVARLWICTSRYHVRRCRLLFRLAGLHTLGVPIGGERDAVGWPRWLYYHGREVMALPYHALRLLVQVSTDGTR